jgi:hypothetical protein
MSYRAAGTPAPGPRFFQPAQRLQRSLHGRTAPVHQQRALHVPQRAQPSWQSLFGQRNSIATDSAVASSSDGRPQSSRLAKQLVIDTIQDQLQLARADDDTASTCRNRERNAKCPAPIEQLVEQAIAAPVMPQQLRVRTPAVVEHYEQRLLGVPSELSAQDTQVHGAATQTAADEEARGPLARRKGSFRVTNEVRSRRGRGRSCTNEVSSRAGTIRDFCPEAVRKIGSHAL